MGKNIEDKIARMKPRVTMVVMIVGGLIYIAQLVFYFYFFIDIHLNPIKEAVSVEVFEYIVDRFFVMFWGLSIWGVFFVAFSFLAYKCMKDAQDLLKK